jgi:uncharacterized protein
LQVLGTAAAAATLEAKLRDRSVLAATTAAPGAPEPVAAPPVALHPVAPGAQPFSLTAARLLNGPFKDAQERDGKISAVVEPRPDAAQFSRQRRIGAEGPVYGGWESAPTWADIRAHGHTLGHDLTACALMYASTGNDEFKKRCDYIVGDLEECQTAAKTGLINAFPDNTTQIDNLVKRQRATGVPWYTLQGLCRPAGCLSLLRQPGGANRPREAVRLGDRHDAEHDRCPV